MLLINKSYRLFRRNRLPPSARRCAAEKIPVEFVTVWAVTNRREHTATAVPHTAVTNVAIQCVAFEIENASISGDAHRLGASSVKRWQCGDGPHCRQRLRACQAIALNLSSHGLFASTPHLKTGFPGLTADFCRITPRNSRGTQSCCISFSRLSVISLDLIAWQRPLIQVLSLPQPKLQCRGGLQSPGDLFRSANARTQS